MCLGGFVIDKNPSSRTEHLHCATCNGPVSAGACPIWRVLVPPKPDTCKEAVRCAGPVFFLLSISSSTSSSSSSSSSRPTRRRGATLDPGVLQVLSNLGNKEDEEITQARNAPDALPQAVFETGDRISALCKRENQHPLVSHCALAFILPVASAHKAPLRREFFLHVGVPLYTSALPASRSSKKATTSSMVGLLAAVACQHRFMSFLKALSQSSGTCGRLPSSTSNDTPMKLRPAKGSRA